MIHVIDTACDGEETIRKVLELRPDVVLLDVEMPVMDGFSALAFIMAHVPTPVVIISGIKEPAMAVKALFHGAIDFIPKPSGTISYDIEDIRTEIILKVKTAAGVNVKKMVITHPLQSCVKLPGQSRPKEVIIIGASTGGQRAIAEVLSSFPPDISAPVIVVQHMSPEFIPSFVEFLKLKCLPGISVAKQGNIIRSGRVFVSPGGCNISIIQENSVKKFKIHGADRFSLSSAIDFTMRSAAKIYAENVIGVLLTGMGTDGAMGLKEIKNKGGKTIVEDESTCVVFGMPKAAISLGCVDEVLPLPQIASAIMRLI
jgi:two-component system chemotaxis response regulator CheB